MALSPEDFAKLKQRLAANTQNPTPTFGATPASTPGFGAGVASDLQQRGVNLDATLSSPDKAAPLKGLDILGQGAGFVADIGGEAVKSGIDALPEQVRAPAKTASLWALSTPAGKAGIKALQTGIDAFQEFKKQHPDVGLALEDVFNIAALYPGAKGASVVGDTGKAAVDAAANTAAKAGRATTKLIEHSSELVNPKPTAIEATGEILQGKRKDLASGVRAIANIDTAGVKTNAQLKSRIDAAISTLSQKVDDHLGQDKTLLTPAQLATKTVAKGGKEVSRNYVTDALTHLKELYTTTADDVALTDIDEILAKAQTEGLTRLEVNDVARVYGQEFGKKAFGKLGEPLTSVNAQLYENIRKGIKAKAREGLGGVQAAKTDKIITSLYNTRSLVEKNVEAVQKLQQRIADRGLLEKVGHGASKYADMLTGGTLRGLIGGLLPRGAGYKVMNALDLEARLEKNLDIINKAVQSSSEEELIKAVKALAN